MTQVVVLVLFWCSNKENLETSLLGHTIPSLFQPPLLQRELCFIFTQICLTLLWCKHALIKGLCKRNRTLILWGNICFR